MCRVPSILSVNTFPRKGPSRALAWNYYVTNDSLLVRSLQGNVFSRSYRWGNPRIFSFHYGKEWRQKARHVRKYNISRASPYRILNYEDWCLERNVRGEDIRRRGRPRKLIERDERLLLRQIDVPRRQDGSFTVKRLMLEAGIDARTVSCKTVRRLLHRHGYKYIKSRRKGVLTVADHERRLKFARAIKREYTSSCGLNKSLSI